MKKFIILTLIFLLGFLLGYDISTMQSNKEIDKWQRVVEQYDSLLNVVLYE